MKIQEILQETKKKGDIKWIAKLKDGKTKTIWAQSRYDAKQKLGTSILIQGGYTIKKAPITEGQKVKHMTNFELSIIKTLQTALKKDEDSGSGDGYYITKAAKGLIKKLDN